MFNAIVDTKPIRDGESPTVSYTIERLRDGVWTKEKVVDVSAGDKDASRKILLDNDQRLVVQAVKADKTVYDPKQSAVVAEGSESNLPMTAEGRYRVMQEEERQKQKEADERKAKESAETQGNERQLLRDQQQPAQHVTTQVAASPAPQKPNPAPASSTSTTGMRSSKDLK